MPIVSKNPGDATSSCAVTSLCGVPTNPIGARPMSSLNALPKARA
jgi:hypothetical protein